MPGKINLKDKILPKDSEVVVIIDPGVTAGTEILAENEPDEGYKFDIAYFELDVPDNVEANVIVETESGKVPLLKENVTNTTEYINASDFDGLYYLEKFSLYVKVLNDITTQTTVTLRFGGKEIIPFL